MAPEYRSAVASVLPSPEKLKFGAKKYFTRVRLRSLPVAASQKPMVWYDTRTASSLPSGLKRGLRNWSLASTVYSASPRAASHTCTAFAVHVTTLLPSGETAREETEPPFGWRVQRSWPVAVSQTWTVWQLSSATASVRPPVEQKLTR